MLLCVDNFLDSPDDQVLASESLEYKDYTDGELTFSDIAVCDDDASINKVSQLLNRQVTSIVPPFYRKFYKEKRQQTFIHSDIYEGDITCIVYLNKENHNNGLSFWTHKATGLSCATKDNLRDFVADNADESKWSLNTLIPAKYNQAVIFSSDMFHSRYPKAGWDTGGDQTRLIKVIFLRSVNAI